MHTTTPYRDSTSFVRMCTALNEDDDEVIGAVIELLIGYKLTNVESMHSHLDHQWMIKPEQLKQMVGLYLLYIAI